MPSRSPLSPWRWLPGRFALVLALTSAARLGAQSIDLDRPGDREFILDRASLLTPDDASAIRATCDELLTSDATPIIVVTIETMEAHSRYGAMRIETFAHLLFDQWEIGHAQVGGADHNRGVLVLVSRDDRKARIQLGAGWGARGESESRRIMDTIMVPRFKQGDYSAGIREAVDALASMARSPTMIRDEPGSDQTSEPARPDGGDSSEAPPRQIPPPSEPADDLVPGPSIGSGISACPIFGCGGGGLVILLIAARLFSGILGGGMFRRSGGGFGGPWMGGGFGGSGGSRSGGFGHFGGFSSGGGGFSGGSFGGGFSGGRGASGKW